MRSFWAIAGLILVFTCETMAETINGFFDQRQLQSNNEGLSECPPKTTLDPTSQLCVSCPYDCYTCDLNNNCLSCDSETSKRDLDSITGRCKPSSGYYESNETVAFHCEAGCLECSSLTECTACQAGLAVVKGSCAPINCPLRTYLNVSTCAACPFDCETCNSDGKCLTCSQLDHRVLSSTGTCVPEVGYYQNYRVAAASCAQGCAGCTTYSYCTRCLEGYGLYGATCQIQIEEQCDQNGQNCDNYLTVKIAVPVSLIGCICLVCIFMRLKH